MRITPARDPWSGTDGDEPTDDAFARGQATGPADRPRTRRGGPRAPFLLLPLIGVAAGVGIAYVSQSAHLTQAGYEESTLAAQQADLKRTDAAVGDQLDRLRSPSIIDQAALRLGFRPPSRWTYVPAQPAPVAAPPGLPVVARGTGPGTTPSQTVVEALGGHAPGGSAP